MERAFGYAVARASATLTNAEHSPVALVAVRTIGLPSLRMIRYGCKSAENLRAIESSAHFHDVRRNLRLSAMTFVSPDAKAYVVEALQQAAWCRRDDPLDGVRGFGDLATTVDFLLADNGWREQLSREPAFSQVNEFAASASLTLQTHLSQRPAAHDSEAVNDHIDTLRDMLEDLDVQRKRLLKRFTGLQEGQQGL